MIRFKSECHYCGDVKEFARQKDMERYLCQCNKKPLLTIELQDENSAPVVYYKGKRLKYLDQVALEWGTARVHGVSNLDYEITRHVKGFKKESIKLRTRYDE